MTPHRLEAKRLRRQLNAPGQDGEDEHSGMTAALNRLFDRHGRLSPRNDPRLHALRQSALWLLRYHDQLTEARSYRLLDANVRELQATIRHIASERKRRNPCRAIPEHIRAVDSIHLISD